MSIINWTYQGDDSRQRTARDIAEIFAADPEVWDGQRRRLGHLQGKWLGDWYAGEFVLASGCNTYQLKCVDGVWTVSA